MSKIITLNVTIIIRQTTEPDAERYGAQELRVGSGTLDKKLEAWLVKHSPVINVVLLAGNLLLKLLNMF